MQLMCGQAGPLGCGRQTQLQSSSLQSQRRRSTVPSREEATGAPVAALSSGISALQQSPTRDGDPGSAKHQNTTLEEDYNCFSVSNTGALLGVREGTENVLNLQSEQETKIVYGNGAEYSVLSWKTELKVLIKESSAYLCAQFAVGTVNQKYLPKRVQHTPETDGPTPFLFFSLTLAETPTAKSSCSENSELKVQPGLECLQGWDFHDLSEQLVSVPHYPYFP